MDEFREKIKQGFMRGKEKALEMYYNEVFKVKGGIFPSFDEIDEEERKVIKESFGFAKYKLQKKLDMAIDSVIDEIKKDNWKN